MSSSIFSWRLLTGMAVAGALGWVLSPDAPTSAAALTRAGTPWALPELPRRPDMTALVAGLASTTLWGRIAVAAPAAAPPPADTRWRIAGLFGRGTERRALILFNDSSRAPAYVKVGDRLPTGHVVTAIEANEICVRIGQMSYRLNIERTAP